MTISIWRFSHLALAIASSVFLLVASVTGVILAVEPIAHQTKGYAVQDLDHVSLATSVEALKTNYEEVFSLEVEPSGFVKAAVLTDELETMDLYIDAKTGEKLGVVEKRPQIFSFATNLHRSLFLKSIGRFFVGLISLLLFLITLTGMFLLVKRQGGIKRFFSKVQKEYFEMRYHVVLSRWLFIPISILALTGVYLSAEKFNLLPNSTIEHRKKIPPTEYTSYENIVDIPFFIQTKLSEVRKVEFPFSEDPEDYFIISLKDREIKVNQQTGTIVSSAPYPFVVLTSRLSLSLHTGEGSVLWSIVLLFASGSVIFFMYSGFVMTLKRRKKVVPKTSMPNKDECEYVILVGSETGTCFDYATRLYNAITATGKKALLSEMNLYTTYANAKRFIILTSTYGDGEAPTNARNFVEVFKNCKQPNPINYAVVGFGSLEYPDYCQFAVDVSALLQTQKTFQADLPLYKINGADYNDFEKWTKKWSDKTRIPLKLERPVQKKKRSKVYSFKIMEKTNLNIDNTFLLRLKPLRNVQFTSGDLLAILPKGTKISRQYSIAKMGDEILLSVKKHKFGRGSSFLYSLEEGDILKGNIEINSQFHFPNKTKSAVLIANGTGIAPFLGMINTHKNTPIKLLWGGRYKASSAIYDTILEKNIKTNKFHTIHNCFSRESDRQYVQDLVILHSESVLETLNEGGTILICGSLTMQHGVLEVLEKILMDKQSPVTLDILTQNGQLKMDCY